MGKSSPPPAPDYTPFIQASQNTAASDSEAAKMQFQLGQEALAQQKAYADRSAARGDDYYRMAVEAQDWARQQFNTVWPYANDYLQTQQALSHLAGENASEALATARENRRQATETYNRYMQDFVPLETKFMKLADEYATPARADQASAAAQADVAKAYGAQEQARENQLKSYGIDPSQARYQGESALAGLSQAGAQAAAGTQARRQQEALGMSALQQAAAMGQKLPTTALAQIEAATQGASGGISGGQAGGGGITAANAVYGTGATAGGSPVGFGYLSNPYTSLSGNAASVGTSLYGAGNSALANAASATNVGANALNSSFGNQMSQYNAQLAADKAPWDFLGKVAGTALGFGTGSGKLFGYSLWGG